MIFDVMLLKGFSCKKNGKEIEFPFKKTAILFAYLVINKEANRKDLAKLLWSNVDESEVRKNLRNALYTLRKVIDADIIITEGNSKIYLNDKYTYNCDYLDILNETNAMSIVDKYGDFLSDISLTKADNYINWITEIQNDLLNVYIEACDKIIDEYQTNNDYDSALMMLEKKVKYYQYDEKSYRDIMNIYLEKKEYDKGIEAYKKINEILASQLKITCQNETFILYEKIVNEKINMLKSTRIANLNLHNDLIYKKLVDAYEKLVKYDSSSYIVLDGETGGGKTFLINSFLASAKKGVETFKIYCYKDDSDYVFKCLEPLISQLAKRYDSLSFNNLLSLAYKEANLDFNQKSFHYYFDRYFLNMLKKITEFNKLILIVEDAHFMDISSQKLLANIIESDVANLVIICASSQKNLLYDLEKVFRYEIINWSINDVKAFIKKKSSHKISDEGYLNIMKETKGNPYHIKMITTNDNFNRLDLNYIYQLIYDNLDENERSIVNILSVFSSAISLANLHKIISMMKIELIESLRTLEEKEVLVSFRSCTGINYQLMDLRFKEYVYINLNKHVKRQLHNTIANKFESFDFENQTSVYLYQLLINHYNLAFNKVKELEFEIKYNAIKNYYACELFSIMDISLMDTLYLAPDENFEDKLLELENELYEYSNSYLQTSKYSEMSILFFIMKARYYLNKLDNENSFKALEKLLELVKNSDDIKSKHNAYYLMIYYAINANDLALLNKILARLLKSIRLLDNYSIEYTKAMITYSRFKGYYYLVTKHYEKAISYFKKALIIAHNTIFDIDVTYQASVYYYLGQAYLIDRKFKKALDCFNHTHRLLMKDNLLVDAILITKGYIAIASYLNNDLAKAHEYALEYNKNQIDRGFHLKRVLFSKCFDIILEDKEISSHEGIENDLDIVIFHLVTSKV